MTFPSRKLAFSALTLIVISLAGCTKYPNRDDGRFRCECGNLEWDGRVLELRMAEVVAVDSVNFNYHVVADLRSQSQIESRLAPEDIVINIQLAFQADADTLTIDTDDEANFSIQELQATGPSADWVFEQAVYDVNISDTEHVLDLYELTANRNGQTVTASGQFIFDLDD